MDVLEVFKQFLHLANLHVQMPRAFGQHFLLSHQKYLLKAGYIEVLFNRDK